MDERTLWKRECNKVKIETVYSNPWFSVKSRNDYFSLEYDTPQIIVLATVENSVLMVKVNRPLINDTPWELPAGGAHQNESFVRTAQRELSEETGIFIADLKRFTRTGALAEQAGRSNELIQIMKIELTPEEYQARIEHDAEITEVRLFSRKELAASIVSGAFYLTAPVAVIARYLLTESP
ncbi:MAG: hypothetical protein A2096_15220 [Spirochaetes bacterium GWF1_41_5]|nr:MAG: hypothetical protein A2096_15220 [Spirochaetes bacterium GWF1_41_5]